MNPSIHAAVSTFRGASLALALLVAPAALAQETVYLGDGAGRCDMFRSLSRMVPAECARTGDAPVLTRGLSLERGIKPRDGEAGGFGPEVVAQKDPPPALAFAMRVPFDYDSFQLTADAKLVLDEVAAVLKDGLMGDKVVRIEGHADAHGPDQYNVGLSQMRARSVRAYLVERHGVSAERLPFVGKGEQEPHSSDPYDGINRRVEFHNLTG
jgi:outer membrane protein OmpA-like peptidoglycan-associated protein